MFYISAVVAILGGLGYQFFVKRVPVTLNPLVNVVAVYLAVIVFCFALLPLFPLEGGLVKHLKQLSWLQLAGGAERGDLMGNLPRDRGRGAFFDAEEHRGDTDQNNVNLREKQQ